MTIYSTQRLQSVYVPVSDGVRLAIGVWLPVERIARGERVGTAFRATRYHRAEQPPSPDPEADSNRAAGELWTSAGFALVIADARGTGASFGSRTSELGPREIADYSELIDWVAAQPSSNGRVGIYGTSYEGQAAELVASVGNPSAGHLGGWMTPLDRVAARPIAHRWPAVSYDRQPCQMLPKTPWPSERSRVSNTTQPASLSASSRRLSSTSRATRSRIAASGRSPILT